MVRALQAGFDTGAPASEEVASAISTPARRKAEGVDGVQAELLQFLDNSNQDWRAGEILRWWANKSVPKRYKWARAASIYRIFRPQERDNYRPISRSEQKTAVAGNGCLPSGHAVWLPAGEEHDPAGVPCTSSA